jgi:DNA-binding LytR/AlgR family response regulator
VRILILEDDFLTALDIRYVVEDCGHQVVEVCATLAEARRHLSADLEFAFLDIDLPDGKSFELASTLERRAVPFAFVSASMKSEVPAHLRRAPFIAKPYQHAALKASLAEVLAPAC